MRSLAQKCAAVSQTKLIKNRCHKHKLYPLLFSSYFSLSVFTTYSSSCNLRAKRKFIFNKLCASASNKYLWCKLCAGKYCNMYIMTAEALRIFRSRLRIKCNVTVVYMTKNTKIFSRILFLAQHYNAMTAMKYPSHLFVIIKPTNYTIRGIKRRKKNGRSFQGKWKIK